jgi:hypothetical protein
MALRAASSRLHRYFFAHAAHFATQLHLDRRFAPQTDTAVRWCKLAG